MSDLSDELTGRSRSNFLRVAAGSATALACGLI
jgi:hypothetical protein